MKLTDRFVNYNKSEIDEMFKSCEEFLKTFTEAGNIIKARQNSKLKVQQDTTEDNSIWIDPSIVVEFKRMENTEVSIAEVIVIYDKWFDQLYRLVKINEHRLHRKAIQKHIVEIYQICSTFGTLMAQASIGLTDQQ